MKSTNFFYLLLGLCFGTIHNSFSMGSWHVRTAIEAGEWHWDQKHISSYYPKICHDSLLHDSLLNEAQNNPKKLTLTKAIRHNYLHIIKRCIRAGIEVTMEDLIIAKKEQNTPAGRDIGKALFIHLSLYKPLGISRKGIARIRDKDGNIVCKLPQEIIENIARFIHD